MRKLVSSLAVMAASISFSAQAAETYVSPGVGTLQDAIYNATDDDTLILITGTYGDAENEVQ
ncbi:MAG: hypothetical protein HWE10_00475 [Gammaproteobacteria bacterium]|nr:hypothetical protein [Gammaproteobacteria bacterium]